MLPTSRELTYGRIGDENRDSEVNVGLPWPFLLAHLFTFYVQDELI